MAAAALRIETADSDGLEAPLFELVEVIERLASARTIEDVAAIVRSTARRISGADGVTFVLNDDGRCWYLDEDAIGPLWKGQRFPLTACVSGWAMLNKQTAVIPDIYLDERIPHDAYRPTFVRSLVMTPVRPENPIAAIGAYWGRVGRPADLVIARLAAVARATATAIANVQLIASLEESLERRDDLICELDHRVKNTMSAVLAISQRTLHNAPTPAAFAGAFQDRVLSLSRAHEHLAGRDWTNGDVGELVWLALSPFRAGPEAQLEIGGPQVRLRPEAAVSFLMTCHELAANAAKYGALSRAGGRVEVAWRLDETAAPGVFTFEWREFGGPPVAAKPARRGFGSDMILRGFARDVGGEAHLAFAPEGVCFTLAAPLSRKITPAVEA
jgi:two-component sensor histidine kinase